MTDSGNITIEQRGSVLLMGVNRPDHHNAFTPKMWDELCLAYGRLHHDDTLRCGVLWAHGKHSTTGLDLPLWADQFDKPDFGVAPEEGIDPVGLVTEPCKKPVVVAVQGICFTLGVELMLAADIRIAAKSTRFAQLEVKRGIYPFGGATLRFPIEAGWGNAMRYLLTGDTFNAKEAYRMGIVQEVVPAGEQVERAIAIAESIAQQAPLAVYAVLESSRQVRAALEEKAIADLRPRLASLAQTDDAREGVQSYIEKREAVYRGS